MCPDAQGAKPRLLVVSSYFNSHPGGLEMMTGKLVEGCAGRGHSVTWAATDATSAPDGAFQVCLLRACNIVERLIGLPLPIISPGAVLKLDRAVAASDVVIVNDTIYTTSICAVILSRLHRRPILLVQHLGNAKFQSSVVQVLMNIAKNIVTKPMLASADQVAYVSEVVAEHFRSIRLRRPAVVTFIGIDQDVFRPAGKAEKSMLRAGFGFGERPVVLYVGRFVANKGMETLRRLAALRPDLDFALAGWGPIDPREWRLSNVHVFNGLVGASLADLYRAADLFVLASPSESFSIVVREALACGLPVICGEGVAATDGKLGAFVCIVRLRVDDPPQDAAHAISSMIKTALRSGDSGDRVNFVSQRYGWGPIIDAFSGLATMLARPAAKQGVG